jgi:hypothetical protein
MPLFMSLRGMPARHQKGRGQLFFPLLAPHPQECGCQSRFRRDVHQCHCFVSRLRRCETAAVPLDLLSRPLFFRGTACATVFSACRIFAACPALHINCSSVKCGDPCRYMKSPERFPFFQGMHAQGRRRFRTAAPGPIASSCSPITVSTTKMSLKYAPDVSAMHAAERSAQWRLVPRVQIVLSLQAGRLLKTLKTMARDSSIAINGQRFRYAIRAAQRF